MDLPQRKHPARATVFDQGNRSNIIFVTVCSHKRKPIFANETAHLLLRKAWERADHFLVGRYVIMPDHIHLFCAPAREEHFSLKRWISYWKFLVSKSWPNSEEKPIWQIDAWDRQLRNGSSYTAKWEYVRENPVRHGLVADATNWPFKGELCPLFWHEV